MQRKHVDFPPCSRLKICLSCLVSCQGCHGSVPSTGHNHLCLVDQTRQSLSRQRDGGPSPMTAERWLCPANRRKKSTGAAVVVQQWAAVCTLFVRPFSFVEPSFYMPPRPVSGTGTKISPQKVTFTTFSMSHHFGGRSSKYEDCR